MIRQNRYAWCFLAVPIGVLGLFTFFPTIAGLGLAFFSWSGSGPPRFVGLANFRGLTGDARFWPALINSLVFTALTVPLATVSAFALASIVNAPWFRGRSVVQSALFFPTIVSIVAVGFVWRWVLDDRGGIVPQAMRAAGLEVPPLLSGGSLLSIGGVNLLAWPMVSLAAVQVWRTVGLGVLLYVAAMQNISPSLYDAAQVDGAGRWRCLRAVTWPGVRPMTLFLLVTGAMGALQAFDVVWALAGAADSSSTDVLNWFAFRQFQQNRLGYAAAAGAVIFAITALATLAQVALAGRRRA
jgi:ABC-type sugar transport system permease subunit